MTIRNLRVDASKIAGKYGAADDEPMTGAARKTARVADAPFLPVKRAICRPISPRAEVANWQTPCQCPVAGGRVP
jgi:hypothetical protein